MEKCGISGLRLIVLSDEDDGLGESGQHQREIGDGVMVHLRDHDMMWCEGPVQRFLMP